MTGRHRIGKIDALLPACRPGRDQRVEEIEDIRKKPIIENPSLWIEIIVNQGDPVSRPGTVSEELTIRPASYDARSAAFRMARLAITRAI